MSMFHCILLNPTIDKIFHVPDLVKGGTYNITEMAEFPVGKAISVALTLQTLHQPVRVCALIGEHQIPQYHQFLTEKDIIHQIIPIPGQTRSNITIVDDQTSQSTHFRLPGFQITSTHLKMVEKYIATEVNPNDFVIFSGSCPVGTPPEYFFQVSPLIAAKKAKLVIDTSGDRLKSMILYHPYLIKSNLEEMGQILGKKLILTQEFTHAPTKEELYNLLDQMEELTRSDTTINILTLGKYGALFFTRVAAYHGAITLDSAPYTVGSGDAFLGGLLASISNPLKIEHMVRLATACGAANTQTLGAGILTKSNVDAFYPRVNVTRLK